MSSFTLSGDVRRLPPSWGLRILQALSLWLLVRTIALAMARIALGYRQRFELSSNAQQLILQRQKSIWGRCVRRSESVLPLARLQEITLETRGESPGFTAGLAALCLGSLFGFRLLTQGGVSSSGSMLSWGLALVLFGLLADFFFGSGRSLQNLEPSPQLVLKVEGARGWVLSRLEPAAAQAALQAIREALSEPAPTAPAASAE